MSILKKSRDKTFKSNAEPQFKRFYGTGFFAYRFARAGSTTDGISLEELLLEINRMMGVLLFLKAKSILGRNHTCS